jgi:hypothetical protein
MTARAGEGSKKFDLAKDLEESGITTKKSKQQISNKQSTKDYLKSRDPMKEFFALVRT